MMWTGVLLGALACWLLKFGGMSVPPSILERPLIQRIADLIPIALLSALIAVQVFSIGDEVVVDARALGLGFAVIALLCRAPFLVVVFGAAAVAALARLVG